MAIYRGPGGAGDATNDATSQAILAAASAVAAANSEAAAAASAVSASNSASAASTSATNAANSATAADASATNAATSATTATNAKNAALAAQAAAETAETNAETAETNAAASATAAASSASSALSSKNAAASSATSAATSATNASNSATAAATSASNAATSESNAASSATAAASSASAASTSATNAANSASSASTSASTATTQASNAATSATSAATSASNAATSETNAANSASSAAASASTATTQATNAANSATSASSSASSAAASAAAAAASYDNFDDRYLGTKSTAPTLDNDGNALVTGALYYNDGTSVLDDKGMWVYDGAQWLPASAAAQAILVQYDYTATSGQTTFTGADNNAVTLSYTPGSIIVTINGVVLDQSDYTATTGTSVVLAVGATTGDEVNILAFSTFDVANTYTQAQADARFFNVTGDSISGNLTFTGTGNRITGDFSNATLANRVAFQTSTTNGTTAVWALPNGTSTNANIAVFNNSDPTNASNTQIRVSSSSSDFLAGITGTGTYLPMAFYTGGSERLRLDTSGNLGLGVTPSAANIATIQSAYGALIGNNQANIGVNAYYNAGWKYIGTGAATLYTQNTGNSPGGHDWRVAPSGTAGNAITFTQAMTLDASGNLGIGISSPGARLDVNPSSGTIFRAFTSNVAQILIGNGGTSANYYDANTHIFRSGNATETVRIEGSGSLCVGQTGGYAGSYFYKQAIYSSNLATTAGGIGIVNGSAATGGYFLGFVNSSGTTIGNVNQNGASTVAYVTSSDYRLKENIQPMQNALGVVAQLNPVTYNWKADGSDGQGFIAHELQAVVPDCVTGEKDAVDKNGNPVYQGIDTSFLVATLCKAIQELEARVKELESK